MKVLNATGHWFLLLIRCQRPGFISSVYSVLVLFSCNDCSSETFHLVNHLLQSDVHLMLLLFNSCSFVCSFVWLAFRCRYCSELPCACVWMIILVCIIKLCNTHVMTSSFTGIPVSQQHLIWNGMELEDEYCLHDYRWVCQLCKTGYRTLYYRK